MNVNLIYFVVAILTFVSYCIFSNKPQLKIESLFYYGIRIVFFILNVYQLFNINSQQHVALIVLDFLVYCIPIIIYGQYFIYYFLKEKIATASTTWVIYSGLLIIVMLFATPINSERVLQSRYNVVSYKENEIRSTILSDSIEGTDYVIEKELANGAIEQEIISIRTYKEDTLCKHLHQDSSYIERYCTVDTYRNFLGFTYTQEQEEIHYEIYLTDDMYKQK